MTISTYLSVILASLGGMAALFAADSDVHGIQSVLTVDQKHSMDYAGPTNAQGCGDGGWDKVFKGGFCLSYDGKGELPQIESVCLV